MNLELSSNSIVDGIIVEKALVLSWSMLAALPAGFQYVSVSHPTSTHI